MDEKLDEPPSVSKLDMRALFGADRPVFLHGGAGPEE